MCIVYKQFEQTSSFIVFQQTFKSDAQHSQVLCKQHFEKHLQAIIIGSDCASNINQYKFVQCSMSMLIQSQNQFFNII